MVKASALYLVIVIALVIGVLCGAVTLAGYYYRSAYQINFRYDELNNNLSSAVNLLLSSDELTSEAQKLSLFNHDNDSVLLSKNNWGIFDVAAARAYIQKDTMSKAFLIGHNIDSAKWSALYLIDEDRSVSVSGRTHIKGTAFLPKAGLREAYVNNQAYTGDKRLLIGTKKNSEKNLPALSASRLADIKKMMDTPLPMDSLLLKSDSVSVSFLKPAKAFHFRHQVAELKNIQLSGHIVLYSDTTITLDSTAHLDQVLIFAKAITIKDGFKGNCQLFASDSIYVGKNCVFGYPSCLAVINFKATNTLTKKLTIGDGSELAGTALIYDQYKSNIPPVLSLGKKAKVSGEVYVAGLLNLKDDVTIYGSVSANRFLYQATFTRYENYLINVDLDGSRLSPYYLCSNLFPAAGLKKKVLQWLR